MEFIVLPIIVMIIFHGTHLIFGPFEDEETEKDKKFIQ